MRQKKYAAGSFDRFPRTRSIAAVLISMIIAWPSAAESIKDLAHMSLQELSNLEVTSVSKSSELLRLAPATLYVITREEILRSGATSIPEALRLAPNLEVRQLSASNYVASARGFAGNPAVQNFSNKLLILIDGRSVYSPLFSGVYYDVQDVLFEDIDRIEVVGGPGATLWGANAMNGVINIITRSAHASDGAFASAGAGNLERNIGLRYGGQLSDRASYRLYGKAFKRDHLELENGADAEDDWDKVQGGFRLDWIAGAETITAQGDLYRAALNQPGTLDLEAKGGNVLSRWQHRGEASDLQVQGYFDYTERAQPPGGAAFVLRTYDLEFQQSIEVGKAHKVVWGLGERLNRYAIDNSAALLFVPERRSLSFGNVFAQDTIALSERFQLTLGAKFEEDPFGGWEFLPDARFSWRFGDAAMLWASAARAIRSPTPFDHDVVEKVGSTVFLTGNTAFKPERVNAYELGVRGQAIDELSFSFSLFYNRYDDLRTIEPASATVFLPLRWDNLMRGDTYGASGWAKWQATHWWRLSPGFRWLHKKLEFKPGASQLLGVAQASNDASSNASLISSMDLGSQVTFDAMFRYMSALPDPALESYSEINARVGWQATETLNVSVAGYNLLHRRHRESPAPGDSSIERSAFAEARWRF